MAAPNPIDVVEQAYELTTDNQLWLTQIARQVYPLLDGGCGLMAYYYDFSQPPDTWFENIIALDMSDAAIRTTREVVAASSAVDVANMHEVPSPLAAIGEACTAVGLEDVRQEAWFASYLERLNARDMVSLRTVEPGGRGIALCSGQRAERVFDRRTKSLWAKVSVHIAAGRRLRDRNRGEPFEAVLTPSGKLEHAEGESKSPSTREALRTAVQRQEKARGRARRQDPEAATEMWTALVSGRWSLVDHYEAGGRRYIVARRNEHDAADPRALGERERVVAQLAALGKSNKLIAYELGISESTVATHLSSAMRKLRVKSRVELLRVFMQLAAPPA